MPESPDDDLVVGRLRIPGSELVWRTSRSGGPGGQHANTSDTRVDLRWYPGSSVAPSEHQRERLVARLGEEVRVIAADERSQLRNKLLARTRLAERILAGLHVEAPRRATRPTRGSVERRLSAKRRASDRKQGRRAGPEDD